MTKVPQELVCDGPTCCAGTPQHLVAVTAVQRQATLATDKVALGHKAAVLESVLCLTDPFRPPVHHKGIHFHRERAKGLPHVSRATTPARAPGAESLPQRKRRCEPNRPTTQSDSLVHTLIAMSWSSAPSLMIAACDAANLGFGLRGNHNLWRNEHSVNGAAGHLPRQPRGHCKRARVQRKQSRLRPGAPHHASPPRSMDPTYRRSTLRSTKARQCTRAPLLGHRNHAS